MSSETIPRPTRVAALQMTSTADVEANLSTLERLTNEACTVGAEAVLAPECFAYLGPEKGKVALSESLDHPGPILTRCQKLARDCGIDLLLGGFWEAAGSARVRNTFVHLRADGNIAAAYRKIHLFDVDLTDGTVITESETVEAGTEAVVTTLPFGTLGLSICYDLRFPELYRQLVDLGSVALAIPAAFTATTGKDHWHILLRARAIEQQSYVIAAAQVGNHFGDRHSFGHALIVDPWGKVLAECTEGEGVAVADIDPSLVTHIRASLPSLEHRRVR